MPELDGETIITVEISLYEAALLKQIRVLKYGSLTVHKTAGQVRRISTDTSEMLDFLEGRDLEVHET